MLRLAPAGRALLAEGGFTVTDATSAALARRLLDAGVVHPIRDEGGPGPEAVTVVIPVKDRPAQLNQALAALTGLRCIVVDDASDDPTPIAAVARRHGNGTRLASDTVSMATRTPTRGRPAPSAPESHGYPLSWRCAESS
jgi:hypothetical protein